MGNRSFVFVDYKVFETAFFLEKIADTKDPTHARYYLSAFVSAARSITLALQAVMSDVENFGEWYQGIEKRLKEDEASRFFVEIRNASVHLGVNTMLAGSMRSKPNGTYDLTYYFRIYDKSIKIKPPDKDIVSSCRGYYITLLSLVKEAYDVYGTMIDPQQCYTLQNITRLKKSIEDVEEELGYSRGWTDIGHLPDGWTLEKKNEERLRVLRRYAGQSYIGLLFDKYLSGD